MKYLSKYNAKVSVKTADGRLVPCNYLAGSGFDLKNKLHAGLHYTFITYSKTVTYSQSYTLRTGINKFLEFLKVSQKKLSRQSQVLSIENIEPSIVKAFDRHVKSQGPTNRDLVSKFLSALRKTSMTTEDDFPLVADVRFSGSHRQMKSFEPLSEIAFNELSSALKKSTDKLFVKSRYIDMVDKAKPYSLVEIKSLALEQQSINDDMPKWYLIPDNTRALKTLIHEGYPFKLPISRFKRYHSDIKKHKNYDVSKAKSAADIIWRTYNHTIRKQINKVAKDKLISLEELLNLYYPTNQDQAGLALFTMLQTGWNKEIVLAINHESYEHALSGSLSDDLKLVVSEKKRGQSNNIPYESGKSFIAPSDEKDDYSVVNLIKLAKKLSSTLISFDRECFLQTTDEYTELFLVKKRLNSIALDTVANGKNPVPRFTSIGQKIMWESGIRLFLKENSITCVNGRLKTASDITKQLRPTWMKYTRDRSNSPLSVVSLQQGHRKIDTTDVHYDRSAIAVNERKNRLFVELKHITKTIRDKNFKGMLHKSKSSDSKIGSIRLFNIPNHDDVIWGCGDSFKPDFPNANMYIREGEKCSEINKCLSCSKVRVFEDSLTFLFHRDRLLRSRFNPDHESTPAEVIEELEVIQYIFNEWGDEKAIKRAARISSRNDLEIPLNLSALKVGLED